MLKAPKSFFDWCYSQIPTFEWSNKQETISSGRTDCEVIRKRLTKNTNLEFFDDYQCFAIVLSTSRRIEVQSYGFWSEYHKGIQSIDCRLVNLEVFENDRHIEVTESFYAGYVFGLNKQKEGMAGPYTGVKFYENGIERRLMNSELKYIKILAPLSVFNIRNFYKYRREIEYLQKIGADIMAKELMYSPFEVDFRILKMKWLAKHKSVLKNSNKTFEEIILEDKIRERNGKMVPGIERYLNHVNFNKIPKCVGIVRFQNWLIKNKVFFQDYTDYLKLLKKCGVEIDENRACPKDFHRAHQEAVELFNVLQEEKRRNEKLKKDRESRERFKKLLASKKRMELTIGAYAFVLPKRSLDLVNEGNKLHHCVGSYVDDYLKGNTTIVFIRDKDHKNTPLYTMEYKNKKIIQVRAKYNREPPPEVMEAVQVWKQQVEKVRMQR